MVAENEAVLAPSQEEEKVPNAPQDEGVLATSQEEEKSIGLDEVPEENKNNIESINQ